MTVELIEKGKWMQLPREVLIGHDVLQEIGTVCKQLDMGKRAIIVTGRKTRKIAGESVLEILNSRF
jgi:glycerol-1-phosphate dehydrogenase [NAD(P)+]